MRIIKMFNEGLAKPKSSPRTAYEWGDVYLAVNAEEKTAMLGVEGTARDYAGEHPAYHHFTRFELSEEECAESEEALKQKAMNLLRTQRG